VLRRLRRPHRFLAKYELEGRIRRLERLEQRRNGSGTHSGHTLLRHPHTPPRHHQVMSRSGDECVVALTDQWYLTYGEDEWRDATVRALQGMETYNEDARHAFTWVLRRVWAGGVTFGGWVWMCRAPMFCLLMLAAVIHIFRASVLTTTPAPTKLIPTQPHPGLAEPVGLLPLLWPGHAPALGRAVPD